MPRSTMTILAYHRIALPGSRDISPALIDAYPADFEAQMRYVAAKYNVISSFDLVRALTEDYTLPRRALVITFDDGYSCFANTAMPVLRRLGLPVTLFVASLFTGKPQTQFWWDRLYRALLNTDIKEVDVPGFGPVPLSSEGERLAAYEKLVTIIERREEVQAHRLVEQVVESCTVRVSSGGSGGPGAFKDAADSACPRPYLLDWSEIEALSAEGVAVGPHSRSHPILAQQTTARLQSEVSGSWADLQEHVSRPLPIFCYPNGKPHAISREAVSAVQQAGLAGAVTMVAGLNQLGSTNPYLLYRIGMEAGQSLPRFQFKLTPAARFYRRLKAVARPRSAERFRL
ncbi:MAG: polysaccharide deacetylase family protein [Chloroflexota bacterium]|nr:polysaccharide deacetylase family protein [Chloroflexota bacterium]